MLLSVVCPAEMFAAVTTLPEFVALIFAIGGVADEHGDEGCCHDDLVLIARTS
jgi:hypothetical protein